MACPDADNVQIKALSVDPITNYILVSWTSNLSPYAHGYEFFETPGATNADTVFGAGQNNFILERQADTNLLIRLRAINQCGGTITRGQLSDAKHVFMCKIEQQRCGREIHVSWSNASRSIIDIAHFEIWVSIDGGSFNSVATVDASQNSAIIEVSEHLKLHRIFVRAVSSTNTIFANSIADTLTLAVAPEPDFAYIRTVSVINDETVEIISHVDTSLVWQDLTFFIDDLPVKTVTYNEFLQRAGHFLLPRELGFYHFKIRDTCEIIVTHSDSAKPILLVGDLLGAVVNLTFYEYYGWDNTSAIRYYLFEIRDGDTIPLGEHLPNQLYSILFLDSDLAQIMNLSYFVIGYRLSLTNDIIDSTRSNVINVLSRARLVEFATAFVPNSHIPENRTFRPLFVPLPNDRIRFKIYNRFGQIVFSTTDPNHEGWNGTFNNTDVQPGVYMYQFELIRNNNTIREQGVVTLIR